MKEILVYAIIFKTLLLMIMLTLTLLFNKFHFETKGNELKRSLICTLGMGIIDIFFSICNLFYNFNILFYIYIFILLGLLSYSVIKNKLVINKYLLIYSSLLFYVYLWGKNIMNISVPSAFESYIISIILSPVCYGNSLNLDKALYVIMPMLVITIIHNIVIIKWIKEKLLKVKTVFNNKIKSNE